jgi:hypothetical protein
MGDAARFPEAHSVAPLGLGADPKLLDMVAYLGFDLRR